MADKLKYTPNDDDTLFYSSVDYNYWFKPLDTQLNEPNIQNSIKVSKVVKQTNKKLWGLV